VIIPALNEEETIGEVITRVKKTCAAEIIVIDDGSTDNTFKIAKEKGALVIKNSMCIGPSAAVRKGIAVAHGSFIITIDADLDHFPEEIPKLLAVADKGADIVIGERQYLPRSSERILSWFTARAIGITDPLSGFRLYKAKVFTNVDFERVETHEMIFLLKSLMHGFKIAGVSVNYNLKQRKSRIGYSFRVDLRILLSGLLFLVCYFSCLPHVIRSKR